MLAKVIIGNKTWVSYYELLLKPEKLFFNVYASGTSYQNVCNLAKNRHIGLELSFYQIILNQAIDWLVI